MSGCGTAEPCGARALVHGDADTDGLVVEMGNAGSGVGAVFRWRLFDRGILHFSFIEGRAPLYGCLAAGGFESVGVVLE